MSNILAFSLLYWELDGGGSAARTHAWPQRRLDLAFPEDLNPHVAPANWLPRYIDYLYLGFTNATAFSPTDVMPIAPWAKVARAHVPRHGVDKRSQHRRRGRYHVVVTYIVIATALVWVPVGIVVVAGERAAVIIEHGQSWLTSHAAALRVWLSLGSVLRWSWTGSCACLHDLRSSLDNGRRSPRKLQGAVVTRLVGRKH